MSFKKILIHFLAMAIVEINRSLSAGSTGKQNTILQKVLKNTCISKF